MTILYNKKWGGVFLLRRREASTGLIVLSPQTSERGGLRQYKGGDSRG